MRRGAPAAYDVFVLARPTPGVAAMLAIALGRPDTPPGVAAMLAIALGRPDTPPGVAAMLAIALGRREQRLYKAVASIAATPERTL